MKKQPARQRYLDQAQQPPTQYEATDSSNLPPKLIILGLGGGTIYRGRNKKQSNPRPFLYSLLAYLFGVKVGDFTTDTDPTSGARTKQTPSSSQERSLGKEFWTEERLKDERERGISNESNDLASDTHTPAPYEVIIWTSSQQRNMEKNVENIFGKFSSKLLRTYARQTLVDEDSSQFNQKTDTFKNLDIIWKALNANDEGLLLAKSRSSDPNVLPEDASRSGAWGPSNTLLLLEASDPLPSQHYNVLRIPDFSEWDHRLAVAYRQNHPRDLQESDFDEWEERGNPEGLSAQDHLLLQLIGVLEEARWQQNVSSWIRNGGLGHFGEALPNVVRDGKTEKEWAEEGKRVLEENGIGFRF